MNPQSPDAPRISRALKAAERGAMLTQRLLAFSRKQSLHPHAVEMQPLLENLSELMRHSLPATLTLEIEAQQPARPAWIDVGQLENAIINLVMNARDAMEGQKGTIKIRTEPACDAQRRTQAGYGGTGSDRQRLRHVRGGEGPRLRAVLHHQADRQRQRPGLSMVYGFVRQSGGRVAIDSAPCRGATVRLQLPRASVQVVSPVEQAPAQEADRTDKLITVLEDEADVRQTLCEQLHGLGYLTLEAECGEQALALLAASEDIGMLISDLMLPGQMSGAEVINFARQHYPHLPLLLISGRFTPGA